MITRSYRKAITFCESHTLDNEMVVCVRVQDQYGKKHTYNCTPYQAIHHLMFSQFIWFDPTPHI